MCFHSSKPIIVQFYGPAGVGKSTILSCLEKESSEWFADADQGIHAFIANRYFLIRGMIDTPTSETPVDVDVVVLVVSQRKDLSLFHDAHVKGKRVVVFVNRMDESGWSYDHFWEIMDDVMSGAGEADVINHARSTVVMCGSAAQNEGILAPVRSETADWVPNDVGLVPELASDLYR